jgi:acyl transferase domain-containing protein
MNGDIKTENRPEPLAIVGIGCLFPRADSLASYWSNIKHGVDAIRNIPPTHWRPEDYFDEDAKRPDMTYARRGGFLDPIDFDPLRYGISPNNIEATDTTQLLGLVAADMALRDAGYATSRDATDGRPFDRDRTSVILGVTGALELVIPLGARLGHPIWRRALREAGVDDAAADEVVARIADGYVPWQENSFPGLLGNVAAGRIANRFDLGGTNCVVDAACASSLSAIHMAAMELHAGRADMVLTGGLDTFNDIFMYMCFSKTPALSPSGDSRPFAADGDGTILGEGIGVLVLKRLSDAVRDGDRVYCTIRGIGSSSDGAGNAVYAPSAAGQMKALRAAYREAGITPDTIELVEAHGTGTKVGDAVEAGALAEVFRATRPEGTWCALGSVKSMIGHTKAAAGVAGLIKAAMALHDKVLPPTLKVDQPLERLAGSESPLYVNTQPRPWLGRAAHPRRAAISAFGFGGSNFHGVLEEINPRREGIAWDEGVLLFAWSAESRQALAEAISGVDPMMAWRELRAAAAVARKSFSPSQPYRAACVIHREQTPLDRVFRGVSRLVEDVEEKLWQTTPEGAWCGAGDRAGKLAVLFPGQGSQSVGMLRELACAFPEMLDALAAVDAAFEEVHRGGAHDGLGGRLSDHIYPFPAFDKAARAEQDRALADTRLAQPALGAVCFGAYQVLTHFGLQADAVAGHSFGELVALAAAGRIEPVALYRLATARGRLMSEPLTASPSPGQRDRGAMLAVAAPVERIEPLIDDAGLQVVVANRNAPAQSVLSGATDQIERAESVLAGEAIRTRRLNVSAAFHSPLVAGAERGLAEFLEAIPFRDGRFAVYANTTAAPYPADAPSARQILAGQVARPVEFVKQIRRMYDDGARTFVEVGPGSVLTGLVRGILDERPHCAISLDASSGKRPGMYDLAALLAQLAALGHAVDLMKWDAPFAAQLSAGSAKKPALTIPLSGANYMKPRPAKAANCQVQASDLGGESAGQSSADLVGEGIRLPQNRLPKNRLPQSQESNPTPVHQSQPVYSAPAMTEASESKSPAVSSDSVAAALQATEQGILTLERMQQQTADLHRQYLEGQLVAQRCVQQLLEQQQVLLSTSPGGLPQLAASPPAADSQTTVPLAERDRPAPPANAAAEVRRRADAPEPMPAPHFEPAARASLPEVDNEASARVLLEVIADKTGYPVETLKLDMRLDADLGIDSIKRVEILSALQERLPDAPAVKADDLGALQTLRQIVEFLGGAGSSAEGEGMRRAGDHTVGERIRLPQLPVAPQQSQDFAGVLLEVVADKTGYPVETLELSMRLDADLGIDSIKRVEILSALQERVPDAPLVQSDDMGALVTLGDIVSFFHGGQPVATAGAMDGAVTGAAVRRANDQAVGEGIRLPQFPAASPLPETDLAAPVAESALDCRRLQLAPLAVGARRESLDLSHARLYVTDDGGGLATALVAALGEQDVAARVIGLDDMPNRLKTSGLVILAPPTPAADFPWRALACAQRFAAILRNSAQSGDVVLAGVSRLGGAFGIAGLHEFDPQFGSLAGLVKTAAREWPNIHAKVVDISPSQDAARLAQAIADELLLAGPMEVGVTPNERCAVELTGHTPKPTGAAPLGRGEVLVISGGGRGVTAELAVAIAVSWQPTLVLLGRTPEPTMEPQWLTGLASEAEIKRAIVEHGPSRLAPKAVEFQYRRIMAEREIRATLDRIAQAGSRCHYRSIDIRDAESLKSVLAEVRAQHGPIRGLIHAAGVLADRLIEEKTPEQFQEVFGVKVNGLQALLEATRGDDLRVMGIFSSSTARFGRKGQVDYAMANETLNKMALAQAHQRPSCRVVSFNWGPWDGGMVTPQLKRLFAAEGVGVIGLAEGAEFAVRELSAPAGGPVEIVVLGKLHEQKSAPPSTPMSRRDDVGGAQLAFRRQIDVDAMPVLRSHVINGRAVVPMALIIEWLAHGAMHDNPGLLFSGFDDLRIFKGIILDPDATYAIEVSAGAAVADNDCEIVPVELRGGKTLHARANIRLTARHISAEPGSPPGGLRPYPQSADEIYAGDRLFHGPDLHGIEAVEGCGEAGIIGRAKAAPHPAVWIDQPLRSAWLADPLALDAAFQLAILWCQERRGAGSLPTSAARYRQFRRAFPSSGTKIVLRLARVADHAATADIDFLDSAGDLVARMEGYECVIDPSLTDAFARNQLVPQGR